MLGLQLVNHMENRYLKLTWQAFENILFKNSTLDDDKCTQEADKITRASFDCRILESAGQEIAKDDSMLSKARNGKSLSGPIVRIYSKTGEDYEKLVKRIGFNLSMFIPEIMDPSRFYETAAELKGVIDSDYTIPWEKREDLEAAYSFCSEAGNSSNSIFFFLAKCLIIAVARDRIFPDTTLFDETVGYLKERCEGLVDNAYDSGEISEEYLCELTTRDPKKKTSETAAPKYPPLSLIYTSVQYSKLTSGKSALRIFLKGDSYSGKTAQLLDFYRKNLDSGERLLSFYMNAKTLEEFGSPDNYISSILCIVRNLSNRENASSVLTRFLKYECSGARVTLLIDDFDRLAKNTRFRLRDMLTRSISVFENVNIIISCRQSAAIRGFTTLYLSGVKEDTINDILKEKDIRSSDGIAHIRTLAGSPWLLKLFRDVPLDNVNDAITPGKLLKRSILLRLNNAINSRDDDNGISGKLLSFSVNALLPYLAATQDLTLSNLYRKMPDIIRTVLDSDMFPSGMIIDEYLAEHEDLLTNKKCFNTFFKEPLADTMALLKEANTEDGSDTVYEWENPAIGVFFRALYIFKLIQYGKTAEGLQLVDKLSETLLSYEKTALFETVEESAYSAFECAEYLIDLLPDDYPGKPESTEVINSFAFLYCGLAVFYEIYGYESKRMNTSLKALQMLDFIQKLGSGTATRNAVTDNAAIPHFINKLAYFVIKTPDAGEDDLNSAFNYLKSAEEALGIAPNRQLELSRVYGNMGAYHQKIKEYDKALEYYGKSRDGKENALRLEKESGGDNESLIKEIEEGLMRSHIEFATNHFHCGRYSDAIDEYMQALSDYEASSKNGGGITPGMVFVIYGRLVGCHIAYFKKTGKIKMFNDIYDWALEMLRLLCCGIELMDRSNITNAKEINDIYAKACSILDILKRENIRLDTVLPAAQAKNETNGNEDNEIVKLGRLRGYAETISAAREPISAEPDDKLLACFYKSDN